MRYEVRLSGTGGQGVVLAGIILAEAGGMRPGVHVVQTVSYGPQVRGGMSNAEVVISEEEVDYPKPLELDLLVPFTQQACEEGLGMMKAEGLVLLDPALVGQTPHGWVASIPMTRLATEATGRSQMANVVALGAIASVCPLVDRASMVEAVRLHAPGGLQESFLKAMDAGFEAAQQIQQRIAYKEAPSPED